MEKEMEKNRISVRELVAQVSRSDFHKKSVPMGMAAGWPCIHRMGKTVCITIPYFTRSICEGTVVLNSIYCSVTVPAANPDKIMDYTIYPYQREWEDVDYENPVGEFPHEALEGVNRNEYKELRRQLYQYYDEMLDAARNKRPFEQSEEMSELFSRLMEPALYPQYLKLNRKFYSYFCKL